MACDTAGVGVYSSLTASMTSTPLAASTSSALAQAGAALEEAAADLYAPPWQVMWRVTLPQMAPALISGWLLAFTLSLDDLVVASFTSGPGASTLPMVVFSATRLGVTPEVYALATITAACAGAGVVLTMLLRHWRLSGLILRLGGR